MKLSSLFKVVSKEIIKPSSPTPTHLHHYQLSFFDQIMPPMYISSIYFYEKNDAFSKFNINSSAKSGVLKQSLSNILKHYYPLAGRLKDNNLNVDCNDEGVLYREAEVKCQLSDIVAEPNPTEMKKFLPCDNGGTHHLPFAVQVNHFTCGGIAIGACISHKIADGSSFINFMKNWAATARCESDVIYPQFQSSTLCPPATNLSGFDPTYVMPKEKLVLKRFVFSSASVEALKAKYVESSAGLESYPSRVDALSTFIWSRYATTIDQVKSESEKLHIILYAVNLRRRLNPPLPDCTFGNLFQLIPVIVSKETSQEDWYGIVRKLRDAKRKLDNFDVKNLQKSSEQLDLVKEFSGKLMAPDTVVSTFSGLCGFPRYDVDFGWGKPLWIGRASLPYKNLITLTDTKFGDGIEAWINLKEEEMVKFERDKELLSYARI